MNVSGICTANLKSVIEIKIIWLCHVKPKSSQTLECASFRKANFTKEATFKALTFNWLNNEFKNSYKLPHRQKLTSLEQNPNNSQFPLSAKIDDPLFRHSPLSALRHASGAQFRRRLFNVHWIGNISGVHLQDKYHV